MGIFSSIIKGITGLLGDIVGFLVGVDFDEFDDQAQGALVNKQSNIDPIPVVYGSRKVGGVRVFVSTGGGKKNEYLYMAIALCEGEIQAIDQIYVNDKVHTHSDYSGLISVTKKLGADGQQYASLLAGADDSWGASHRLRGVAYLAIRIKYDQDVFGGIPEIQCVIRGRKVYDPRTSTTAYSNNPALCLRDYLTNTRYGKGLPTSAIDDTKFIAAANEYDGTVTSYTGGPSITRVDCNARLDTGKTVFDNVKEMLQGARGLLPYTDGKYGLIVDKSYTPDDDTFDLTPDNILSDITVTDAGKGKRFNRVIAKFPNPQANWQMDSVTYPVKSTDPNSDFLTFLSEDNDEELVREINLNTITSLYQAREMARIVCEASRRNTRSVTLTATSEAMDIAVGDVVRLEQPSLGWTGAARQLMRVVSTRIKDSGEVDLQLIEYNNVYTWFEGDEELDNQNTTLPNPFDVTAPTAPSTSEDSALGPDGGVRTAVTLSWTEADDAFVSEYEVQWALTSASTYSNFVRTSETSVDLFGLDVGSEYTFRIRSINTLGVRSDFVEQTRTLVGDIIAPGAVTLGGITGGIRAITATWTNPADLDYAFTEVHVKDANTAPSVGDSPTRKIAGEEYIHPVGAGEITKYFFLRAVDFSGNKGPFTGTSNNSGTSVVAVSDDIGDGEVDTGQIADEAVDITKIANTLETTNFNLTNGTGWQIKTDGTATFNDVNVRGEVVATQLNVQDATISGSLKANELSDGIVKITSVSQEVWNEIESRVGSTTGSTGFFEAASGNLTGGDLALTTVSTKAHAAGQTVYFELDAVYFWSSATSVSGDDLLLDVKFQHSTDNVTYTTVNTTQVTVERHNYFNGFMYDIDNSVQYQLTGLAAGNYYFRVSLEPVGATPNAFSIAYLGVPVRFEVNEIGTGTVSTSGNADTLDGLEGSQLLRSDVDDTFDADLTITGDLALQGALNITGDINSYNVTDLDVTDKTITVNSGNTQALSNGAGLIVDRGTAADASILWDETNDEFDFSNNINLGGKSLFEAQVITGVGGSGWLEFNEDDDNVWPTGTSDNITVLGSVTHMVFAGDSNANGTGGLFYWGYGQGQNGGGTFTKTMDLDRSGNLTTTGTVTWSGGGSANANTAYTYSQVGHLPLSGGTITGSLTVNNRVSLTDDDITSLSTEIKTLNNGGLIIDLDADNEVASTDFRVRIDRSSGDSQLVLDASGNLDVEGRGTFNELTLTGDSDNLTINEAAGDWTINNAQQNNGITIYDGSSGVVINYNGSAVAQFDSGGGMDLLSGNLQINGVSRITAAGNATLGTISSGAITSTGRITSDSSDIDGFVLENSAHRPGLLNIPQRAAANSYTGIMIERDDGDHWALMAGDTLFGIYDDINSDWALQATEAGAVKLYYAGASKLQTLTDGVNITGKIAISSTTVIDASRNVTLNKLGTATGSGTQFNSPDIRLYASGWDTNNSVARTVGWKIRAVPTASVYPDHDLQFIESDQGSDYIKFQLHGRGSTNHTDPLSATFFGNVSIEAGSGTNAGDGDITVNGTITSGNITSSGTVTANSVVVNGIERIESDGDVIANNLTVAGNFTMTTGSISVNGNLTAANGYVQAGTSNGNGFWVGSTQILEGDTRNLKNIGTISGGGITTSGALDFTANPAYIRNDQDASGQIIISAKNLYSQAQQVRWDAANDATGAWRPDTTNVSSLGLTNKIWNTLYINLIKHGASNDLFLDQNLNVTANNVYLGSTNNSGYLTGNSRLSIDGYMMVKGIINTDETGTGATGITFGNGSTLGTDQISLITSGNRQFYISSTGVAQFSQDVLVLGNNLDIQQSLRHNGNTDTRIEFTTNQMDFKTSATARLTIDTATVTIKDDLIVEDGSPVITISDTSNGGGGGAEGKIIFKNTEGNAIGIGYTGDVITDSDLIISTDASGTYGAYLGLATAGIADTQSDIILEPKTDVRIANGGLKVGTTEVISSSGRFYSTSSTVTKPAFSFDGDSNTGMYHMGADQIGFTIGGSNKVYIEDSTYVLNVLGAVYASGDLTVASGLAVTGAITSGGNSVLTSADYDTHVCHLKTNVDASLVQGSANEFTVNFNLESHNDSTTFSHSSGVVTVATTGWYRIYANMVYENASASARNTIRAYVEKNGTEVTSTATYDYDRGASYGRYSNNKIETMLYLTANDTVSIGNYAENEDGVATVESAECEFIVSSVSVQTTTTNADTVDGLHASSFIRSDANDTVTGDITFSGAITVGGYSVLTSGNQITTAGSITAGNASTSLGYYVGGTQVIQGSTRNLVNIGTIYSGAITSTGTSTFDGIIVDGDDSAEATSWGTAPTAIIGGFSSGIHDGANQLTDFRMAVISKDTNGGNTPVMQRNQAWVTGGISGEAYNSAARWDLGRWENIDTHSRSRLDLYLADDSQTWDHVMTWRAEGSNATRVGINTTTPSATLDVNGSASIEGNLNMNSYDISAINMLTVDDEARLPNLKIGTITVIDASRNATFGTTLSIGNSSGGNFVLKRPSANYIWADQTGGYLVFGGNGLGTSLANSSLYFDTSKNAVFGGNITTQGSMVAAKFSDAANPTGYFVQPSAVSYVHEIRVDDFIRHNADTNTHIQFTGDRIKLTAGNILMLDCVEGTSDYIDIINRVRVTADGDLECEGNITAYTTTSISDINQKQNIQIVENPIEKIKAISGYTFDWKESGEHSGGVIAQEIEQVMPDIVKEKSIRDGEKMKAVDYQAIIGLLVETVKDLNQRIEDLENGDN